MRSVGHLDLDQDGGYGDGDEGRFEMCDLYTC